MISHDPPESDWKIFRELREVALERFCERVLDELEPLRSDTSRSSRERYVEISRLVQKRDRELAHAFDDTRRSNMIIQLAAMHTHRLIEPAELERFTPETREQVEGLARELAP